MPFSRLGGCQVRAARPSAQLSGEAQRCLSATSRGSHSAGDRHSRQGRAAGTHWDMPVLTGSIGTTSKVPRLQTLQNLRARQSVNCAAVCTHYLIFLPPAARLRLDFNPELHFSVGFLLLLLLVWCFRVWVRGFLCVVLGSF